MDPRFIAASKLVREAAEDAVLARLNRERSLAGLCDAASVCHDVLEQAVARFAAALPDAGELACAKGCALCCNLLIRIRPMEGILAATYAETSLSDPARAAIRDAALNRPVPCPFLHDAVCSVYAARPRVCRNYYSFDLDKCRAGLFCEMTAEEATARTRAFDPVRHRHELHMVLSAAIAEGMDDACVRLGIDNRPTHMHALLRILYSMPDAVPRWLRGEFAFPSTDAGPDDAADAEASH